MGHLVKRRRHVHVETLDTMALNSCKYPRDFIMVVITIMRNSMNIIQKEVLKIIMLYS